MTTTFPSKESITGYITNISNENRKNKFYIKFTMQTENNGQVDGWIFSDITGILATPLGSALTNSMKNHTGLRLWGKLEQNNGLTIFKTQAWSNFQKVNPSFLFQTPTNDLLSIRDALMSAEPCSIRVYIIDIRSPENFDRDGVIHTNTFVLIGDDSGTSYLVVIDLGTNTFSIEKSYDLTQVRRKMFNGVHILTTTINTYISLAMTSVTANISEVTTTLAIDLTDKKNIISTVEEIGTINRSSGCSTCKGVLTDVIGAAALVFCQNCQRHSLKKSINYDISTTLAIKNGQEKIILRASGQILERLLNCVGLTIAADDTEIAMALLSNVNLRFEYTELGQSDSSIVEQNIQGSIVMVNCRKHYAFIKRMDDVQQRDVFARDSSIISKTQIPNFLISDKCTFDMKKSTKKFHMFFVRKFL
ncbi:unnamed protein product [Rotaria sp. Silwood2]|nr:unnamed protein product [Rotaria sp. Silwood2]